jgi:hypothetical protein
MWKASIIFLFIHYTMQSYDYVATGIRDYLPNEVDLERDLLLTSEVLRREYVEINPPQNSVLGISSSSIGNVTEIKLSDPSRWVDTSTLCLMFDVGNLQVPTPTTGRTNYVNVCQLDGPFAVLNRMNVSVGGVNLSSINELNKHMSARWLNGAMASHVMQEAQLYNPGCTKLVPVIQAPSQYVKSTYCYQQLANALSNFDIAGATSAGTKNAARTDVMGFPTATSQVDADLVASGFGYQNGFETDTTRQSVCIKIGDICPFFTQMRYLPLFLLKDVIFSFYYASPQQAFMTDLYSSVTLDGSAPADVSITSYDITNIKMVCDLITCSDVLNNRYKMLAASEDGIILPFDDVAVQSTAWSHAKTERQFQCQLSTANLKSLLFYQQSQETQQSQKGWSNTNFHYLGINKYQLSCNNNNLPSNPLNRANEIMVYNNRSRGVIGNELSQFVCNNPYIAYGMECAPSGTLDESVPATFVAFFIYSNFEKIINENPEILRNGLNLKDASSTITIKFCENQDTTPQASTIRTAVLGDDKGAYTCYAQMTYQRSLVLKNGMIELI